MTQVEELTFIDDIPVPDVGNEETPILDRLLTCAEIVLAPDRVETSSLGREPIKFEWPADVRFGADNRLMSGTAPYLKSAKRRPQLAGRACPFCHATSGHARDGPLCAAKSRHRDDSKRIAGHLCRRRSWVTTARFGEVISGTRRLQKLRQVPGHGPSPTLEDRNGLPNLRDGLFR
jgi:hypothetical protein